MEGIVAARVTAERQQLSDAESESYSRQIVLGDIGYDGQMKNVCSVLIAIAFIFGVTLAAALIWRNMCRDADTAIAVGIGAGAFEALLLGLSGLGGVFIALLGMPGSDGVLIGMARIAMITPLAWLVGPVERVIAILCHTSSRALVLLSVAKRRGRLFWWGFMIMTAIDSVAGFVHVSYMIGKASLWWIELAVAPFGIISVPIIRRCLGCWPTGNVFSESHQWKRGVTS